MTRELWPLTAFAKALHFCETQHHQAASLRRYVRDPPLELHPDTAAERGIAEGDWVEIRTPKGVVRARAGSTTHLPRTS